MSDSRNQGRRRVYKDIPINDKSSKNNRQNSNINNNNNNTNSNNTHSYHADNNNTSDDNHENTNTNNNNRVTFAPKPIVIRGSRQDPNDACKSGTFVQSHVEQRGKQKEFFVCIRKPDLNPSLNVEHRDIYSEQLIRLDQGLDILDRNGLNYNLEIDINHESIFMAHISKLISKSGYFFDSIVNFRPNYDFENSRIEVVSPEITSDVFGSLIDLIYYRTVRTCRDGLQAIGRAAQILDMAEVVKACQEMSDPASVKKKPETDPQQQQLQQQQQQQQLMQFHQQPVQMQSPSQHIVVTPSQLSLQPQMQQIPHQQQQPQMMGMPHGGSNQPQQHISLQMPQMHGHTHANGSPLGCGEQVPIQQPGRPPLLSTPFPVNNPSQIPPPYPCQPAPPPHHHHPLPQARQCRRKTCCKSQNCNHCQTSRAACNLCEESPPGSSEAGVTPSDPCCTSNESYPCGNSSLSPQAEEPCCGLPPLTEDGTPPVKSPLQLFFDAIENGASEQFHAAYNKLMDNFVQISMSKDFLNLSHHQLSFILASDNLAVPDEMFVFRSALRWIQFDLTGRLRHAAKVMKTIRFPMLSWEHLLEASREPLLANSRGFHYLLQPSLAFFKSGIEKAASMGYKKSRRRRYTNI